MSTPTNNQAAMRARVALTGTLVVKRANGETVDIEINGTVPLAELAGISEDQARELVRQHQQENPQ